MLLPWQAVPSRMILVVPLLAGYYRYVLVPEMSMNFPARNHCWWLPITFLYTFKGSRAWLLSYPCRYREWYRKGFFILIIIASSGGKWYWSFFLRYVDPVYCDQSNSEFGPRAWSISYSPTATAWWACATVFPSSPSGLPCYQRNRLLSIIFPLRGPGVTRGYSPNPVSGYDVRCICCKSVHSIVHPCHLLSRK